MNIQEVVQKIHAQFGVCEMANYRIEHLIKSAVREAQRWIPMEEGPPERIGDQKYSEKVLVKSIDLETGEELQIDLDWFDFVENMFKDEITLQGLIKVTHWRPIELK